MSEREPNGEPNAVSAAELFPSLERLRRGRHGKVPFIQQLEVTECGAASLAMVLSYLGCEVTLEEMRAAVGGTNRDGTDARTLIAAGEQYGLRGRGLQLDVDSLKYLPAGSILHWELNHYVVFERISKRGIHVVDPQLGRRVLPPKKVSDAFTGVALVFEQNDNFEKRRRGKGRFSWYMSQIAGQGGVLSRVIVTSLLLRVFALAIPLVTAVVVDRVVPRADRSLLAVVALGLAGMLVFDAVTMLVRSHMLLQLRTNLDTRLTLGFVDYLTRLPFQFFQRRSVGDLLMRVNNNSTIRETLTTNTLSALLDGILVLGYAVLIFAVSLTMGALVIGLGALQIFVYIATRGRYRELMARSLEAQARQQASLVEMLAGIETLKASAAESRAVEKWSNLYVDELNVALDRGRLVALVDALGSVLTTGSPLAVLAIGALQVMNNSITLGEMLAVNALALGVLGPLATMVTSALQLQMMSSYMDRIDDVLKTDPEQHGTQVARAPRISGRVVLQGVSFRYSEKAPFVVRDVTVDIKAGSTLAIVGKSGCGKSTLARIIAGLYLPSEGRVLFDGHDLARLELKSLRRQIGMVAQEPALFAGAIRDVITLTSPNAPYERIVDAARMAAIHDDIAAMPLGYTTILADGGRSLSGGQRQRLALARALIHEPRILILDEATSALDADTERRVMESLSHLKCTQIVLAHRLSTIMDADLILVMEAGEVVEAGTHKELLARGAHYARLVAAQMRTDGPRGVA